MKIKPYRVCDICGDPYYKSEHSHLKIKKRYSVFDIDGWDTLDLCPKCANEMISLIKKIRKEEQNAGN